jgi:glutathione synthase/RimK-type ligase-like ATP-grasp enzyme
LAESEIVLLTDHSSQEGSRAQLATAVEILTGTPPVLVDARHFMTGGSGHTSVVGGSLRLHVPSDGLTVTPSVVLVYEIPPTERRRFAPFQRRLRACGAGSLGSDPDAWQNATEKDRTVRRFVRDNIPHMETMSMHTPTLNTATSAFEKLDRNVWARPTIGAGGRDVFHVTTHDQLRHVLRHYASIGLDWLISRDAQNFTVGGERHQFRVFVLQDRVLRVCEHVQQDPDAPCNLAQGALGTEIPIGELSDDLLGVAVSATRSLGLAFGEVDLAIECGGVVFEVNVHPVILSGGLETVAIPFVEANIAAFHGRREPSFSS